MYAPLVFFTLHLVLGVLISSQKQFEATPAEGRNFASLSTWPLLLMLILLSCSFYCCVHMYAQLAAKAVHSPTFPVNVVFMALLVFNIFSLVYDNEVSREMQAGASFGHLRAYIFGVPSLYPSKVHSNGVKAKSRAMQVLLDAMGRSIGHWVFLCSFVVGTVGVFILLCTLTYSKWRLAFSTQKVKQELHADAIQTMFSESNANSFGGPRLPRFGSRQGTSQQSSIVYHKEDYIQDAKFQQRKRGRKVLLVVFTFLAVLDIILFFTTANNAAAPALAEAAPGNWNMLMSLAGYGMREKDVQQAIQRDRQATNLPDGLYYIDQRPEVQFPYVVGDWETFCQFNDCTNRNMVQLRRLDGQANGAQETGQNLVQNSMPNVVFVIVESFAPNPIFLAEPRNHLPYNENQPFNVTKIPNIARLASSGQTQQTVSALGLPTIYGWHSLMTGHQPLIRGVNMAQEFKNDWFSLAQFFKLHGYTTSYNSPSPPEFDGKHNYLYRGDDFDYVEYNFPEAGEALPEPNSWVADRLTEQQFEQQLSKLYATEKPFFAVWMTVDMHTPFQGYDLNEFYDADVEDDYERVAKYTDKQIGKLLDYLQQQDNNTIVALIGDHGARERPLASKNKDLLNESCTGKVFSDSYFLTSGIMSYFGDNPVIKQRLPPNTNIINSTDANSFVLQLQLLIGELSGRPFITNRAPSQISNAHRVLEYRNNGTVYRSFAYSQDNSQEFAQLPSCLMPKRGITTNTLQEARQAVLLRNMLQSGNRMWSDAFVCNATECALPPAPSSSFLHGWDIFWIIYGVLVVCGAAVGWVVTLCVWHAQRLRSRTKKIASQ